MSDMNKNNNKSSDNRNDKSSKESAQKLNTKIKETWSGLSDEDIKLYATKPDQFFSKLQEKQKVSKEDAQKQMKQMEKDCGCGVAKAA